MRRRCRDSNQRTDVNQSCGYGHIASGYGHGSGGYSHIACHGRGDGSTGI